MPEQIDTPAPTAAFHGRPATAIPQQRTGPQQPSLGAPTGPAKARRWLWWAAVLVAFLVGLMVGKASGTAPTAAVQQAAAPAPTAASAAPIVPSALVATFAPAPTTAVAAAPVTVAPVVPAAPPAPAGPATSMGDGTYQVGVDIAAGRYKTAGPDKTSMFPFCYWERASNDSGDFSSIIANDNLQGPGSVSVKKGEFLKLSGGCDWTKQ